MTFGAALRILLPSSLLLIGCSTLLDGDFEPAPVDATTDVASPDGASDAGPGNGDPDDATWVKVAAGGSHTCGLRSDGSLWCWGDYTHGQLGHGVWSDGVVPVGSAGESYPQPAPVRVRAARGARVEAWNDWTDVALGASHSCGLREDGTLWCWGNGRSGRLGHGSREGSPLPVQVVAAEEAEEAPWNDWLHVSAGGAHTCGRRAHTSGGTLWCWGSSRNGGLGNGVDSFDEDAHRLTPDRVLRQDDTFGNAWTDWRSVSLGSSHSCGPRADGSLWCWGSSHNHVLGTGNDEEDQPTPQQVAAAEEDTDHTHWEDWVQVTAGGPGGCGRRNDGTAWCWGTSTSGALGDGRERDFDDATRSTPTQVLQAGEAPGGEGWDDWAELQGGSGHVCGLREDGTLWCWGAGSHGRLGNDSTANRNTPSQVLRAGEEAGGESWGDWVQVATGSQHACGVREDGTLWCWGNGRDGRRGDGEDNYESFAFTPVQVLDPEA